MSAPANSSLGDIEILNTQYLIETKQMLKQQTEIYMFISKIGIKFVGKIVVYFTVRIASNRSLKLANFAKLGSDMEKLVVGIDPKHLLMYGQI